MFTDNLKFAAKCAWLKITKSNPDYVIAQAELLIKEEATLDPEVFISATEGWLKCMYNSVEFQLKLDKEILNLKTTPRDFQKLKALLLYVFEDKLQPFTLQVLELGETLTNLLAEKQLEKLSPIETLLGEALIKKITHKK